jgi:hypothetical protein
MPPSRGPDRSQTGAGPGKHGKHGKLADLIRRKPLEAIGAGAGVLVIGIALWKRHHNAGQDAGAAGRVGYLAPQAPPLAGGQAGNYQAQIDSLQSQLDQLERQRHRRRHPDRDRHRHRHARRPQPQPRQRMP